MSAGHLTPQEAAAAVGEASRANVSIRQSDRLFAMRLLALAGATIGLALVIVVIAQLPGALVIGRRR